MELYLATRASSSGDDAASPSANRRRVINSLLTQTGIGEPAVNKLCGDRPTSATPQRATTPQTMMVRPGGGGGGGGGPTNNPPQQPQQEESPENPSTGGRFPVKPKSPSNPSGRPLPERPGSPRRLLPPGSPRHAGGSSAKKAPRSRGGVPKPFAEVLSQKCAVCAEFDRCAFCFRSKLTTQRRMHMERFGLATVLQQPEIKPLELIKHICQYARSDTYAKAANEQLAWLEQRVDLCETHDDLYVSLEEERRAAGSKSNSLQQALNKANKANASLHEQLASMTRMLKAEDLDEGQSGSELKKAARKNIELEAQIIRLKEEAASNAVKLLAVDKVQQDMTNAHKAAMEEQRHSYEQEVKLLRADLEKDRTAMRHLDETLHKLHESHEEHKGKNKGGQPDEEDDLLLAAEREAHALLEVMDDEISEARALAVTHGHGTLEDQQNVDIEKLDKAATHEVETAESHFDFASPYARYKNAPPPPDMAKREFCEGVLETIKEVMIEKLRVDEHDVELGLDPQPFALVFRDIMTSRYGSSSLVVEKKIREFVAAALELAERGSIRANIFCNLLGISKKGTDDVYSPHIGDALFDLFGAICKMFWEPGIRNANSKVGKCLLLYPEDECVLDKKNLLDALECCESLVQYLDPEALKLMAAHIEYEDLKEPEYDYSKTLPEAVRKNQSYISAKEACTFKPSIAGLALDWFLDYALKQIVLASKRHAAFLYRMFNHFAAEDNDTINMSFAEFGDLIDSCVSDDTEKRRLHRQQYVRMHFPRVLFSSLTKPFFLHRRPKHRYQLYHSIERVLRFGKGSEHAHEFAHCCLNSDTAIAFPQFCMEYWTGTSLAAFSRLLLCLLFSMSLIIRDRCSSHVDFYTPINRGQLRVDERLIPIMWTARLFLCGGRFFKNTYACMCA